MAGGRSVLIALFALAVPGAALACEPAHFPVPDEIRAANAKMDGGQALTEAEQFLLESYNTDRDHYQEVYEQIYPCSFYGGEVITEEGAGQDVLKQDLLLLERKWGQQGATQENLSAPHETFVDVPEGTELNVE